MKYKNLLIFFFLILLLISCSKENNEPEILNDNSTLTLYKAPMNLKFQVVGYFPSYRDLNLIPDSKLKMMDVVIYAFASINESLMPVIDHPEKLQALVLRCKSIGVKVLLSFNGPHSYFVKMTSQKTYRDRFVDALMELVRQYNLDGIDNDWEFPKISDGSSLGNAFLMKQLSDFCHKNQKYLLTMAVSPGLYEDMSNGIVSDVFNDVDWFNVMIYDNFSTTQPYIQHSTYSMLLSSFNYWITNRNLSRTKFVTGLPLYGRPSGISQTGNTLAYNVILNKNGNALLDSATVTTTSHPDPFTIYYNGINTIQKKVNYSISNGLGGVMFWEISMDTNDNNSLIKTVNDVIGRLY
jgi:GH18 family chitinase